MKVVVPCYPIPSYHPFAVDKLHQGLLLNNHLAESLVAVETMGLQGSDSDSLGLEMSPVSFPELALHPLAGEFLVFCLVLLSPSCFEVLSSLLVAEVEGVMVEGVARMPVWHFLAPAGPELF
jgi:hypothetical protein